MNNMRRGRMFISSREREIEAVIRKHGTRVALSIYES